MSYDDSGSFGSADGYGPGSPTRLQVKEVERAFIGCAREGDMRSARAILRIVNEQRRARPGYGEGWLLAGLLLIFGVLMTVAPASILPEDSHLRPLMVAVLLLGALWGAFHSFKIRHEVRLQREDEAWIALKACRALEEIVESPRLKPVAIDSDAKETVRWLLRRVPAARPALSRLLGLES